MRQVLQDARSGKVEVTEVPVPQLLPGCALVRVLASVVSAGTERASSEFASKNLLQKAQARPDLVRDVLSKMKRDGLASTVNAVRSRLDQPLALGYSSAGIVAEVGEGVTDIRIGDRVACAGAGVATHSEAACVPRLLLAKIPTDNVSLQEAAFTTLGAVALHGVRTAEVKLGDRVALIGLGLLGQLTVQILKAAGSRVLGFDPNPSRTELAAKLGADAVCSSAAELRELCAGATKGAGADSVIITAETSSDEPVNLAGAIARDRAVVCAVGTVGLNIDRKAYFEKELDVRISRSYGPGRYDSAFEQKGRDYPIGYVRWTETRNMEAFLELLSSRKVNVEPMITHRFPIERAPAAYELITGKTSEPFLGVLITYPEGGELATRVELRRREPAKTGRPVLGVLGAGTFAMTTLLPAIAEAGGVECAGVCTATGSRSRHAAEKFGFRYCTTDEKEILNDANINTVVIATRHHLHAGQVEAALRAGKHVFCEKPLCLREDELANLVAAYRNAPGNPSLMVGFNRRFSPLAQRLKAFFASVQEPLLMHYRVNAGYLTPDHWTQDPEQGGGRILGEVCHFVDLLTWLSGSIPVRVQAHPLGNGGRYGDDNLTAVLDFANGSQGAIIYVANGDKTHSKERLEVFGGGSVGVLEDYRSLQLVRNGRTQTERSRLQQDKGHKQEWKQFLASVREGKAAPIPFEEIVGVTLATFAIQDSRRGGEAIGINLSGFLGDRQEK